LFDLVLFPLLSSLFLVPEPLLIFSLADNRIRGSCLQDFSKGQKVCKNTCNNRLTSNVGLCNYPTDSYSFYFRN